ncbi:MocR-like pyridoxine biosynthesis transcription factor PdxR [Nonomuraea guangzhouensis]|uniref:PLP-dependent aminotransferase family protein n=1 Tax=Nonomuraea guangzhouensis TaxID=1291555 RepID=A0ABW4G7R4_9ACTN|nr:PLP-dependent aminotransferase family protein [Nonomuraea guangzhouensis]
MPKNQTNAAWDTLLDLDAQPAGPLHDRLRRALRSAIVGGRIAAGSALPPSRTLAADLGCSRWVVTEAYAQLAAEGYLEARTGSATRVRPGVTGPATGTRPGFGDPPARPVPQPARLGPPFAHPRFDFTPGLPDLRAFPRKRWADAVREAGRQSPFTDLGYLEHAGHPHLRETLAGYLTRSRGAAIAAEDLTICAGTTDGLARIARGLREHGHTHLAVEDPGWTWTREAVVDAGLVAVPIGVDGDGLRVDLLRDQPWIRAAIVAPAHQFPTGTVLAPARRAELIRWAHDVDGILLEEDKDADYRYDRRPVAAIQGMAPSRTALLGSVSKTLSPALRIGWFATPPRWTSDVAVANPLGLPPSVLDQLAFAWFLDDGGYDRHLRACRRRYRARRDVLVGELACRLPGARVSGAAAGLHLLLHLDGVRATEVVAAAARDGVSVDAVGNYASEAGAGDSTLILGYGNLADSAVAEGVSRLADAIDRTKMWNVRG